MRMTSDISIATDLTTTTTTINWRIKGLADNTEIHNLEGIKTKDFTMEIPGHRDSKWMMEIKPGTIYTADDEYGLVKITLHSKNPGTINVHLTPYIWGFKDETTVKTHTFIGESSCELEVSGRGAGNFINFQPGNHRHGSLRIPGGELKIVLDFTFSSPSTTLRLESLAIDDKSKTNQITKNFEQFLLSKEMSDVQITCGDKTFDCPLVILSVWSPVESGLSPHHGLG